MCYLSSFIFGLLFGSFANVCIFRIPEGKSIVSPGSSCRACGKAIKWYDNLPLLSYLILMGKCRHCGDRISIEYPVMELITGIVFILIYYRFRFAGYGVLVLFLAYGLLLIIISVIDLHLSIIPDVLSIGMMITGLLFSPLNSFLDSSIPVTGMNVLLYRFTGAVAGLLLAGLLFYIIAVAGEKVFKKEAMGGGDIKLIAAIGAFTGIVNILWVVVISSLVGGIVGILLMAAGKKKRFDTVPFGPFISIAALAVVLLQPYLNTWYLDLMKV